MSKEKKSVKLNVKPAKTEFVTDPEREKWLGEKIMPKLLKSE